MKTRSWLLSLSCLLAAAASAQQGDALSKEELAAKLPGVEAAGIAESPIPGLYEVTMGSSVAYVTGDGRYVLQGDLYDLDSSRNLTEVSRASARVNMLAEVDPESVIVFSPEDGNVKHRVTIFTDIDCGYCRQFHREIDQVNAMGIEVRYLSFPRTGPDTDSWTKAQRVWCASDRASALTEAKLGGSVPEASCFSNTVQTHYDLGNRIGVRGTPAIFSEQGTLLGGYVPPAKLQDLLEQEQD